MTARTWSMMIRALARARERRAMARMWGRGEEGGEAGEDIVGVEEVVWMVNESR